MRNGPYSKDGVAGALFVRLVGDIQKGKDWGTFLDNDLLEDLAKFSIHAQTIWKQAAESAKLEADKKRRGGV